ncbi:phosphate-starvation-inducible PsiE family protein [Thauera sp. AutoDN2]|uniref:phosphate-starvation-inducible PsiE family protein n=1 Tax=Thauera sp. AutoDN2 TaxID=3416051 RepID=UPI002A4B4892|nr:phosphate-starvation-inducible PsiE family protein [Thauera sp.]
MAGWRPGSGLGRGRQPCGKGGQDGQQRDQAIATALMAIARKVIVLDLSTLEPMYLFAIGVIVLALGVTYWLVSARPAE